MARKEKTGKKRGFFGRLFRFIGTLILLVVLLAAALVGYLTFTEYKPADSETVAVEGTAASQLKKGDSFTIMTWNVGYGALGDNADFFLDGGTKVMTADTERVQSNLKGISSQIASVDPDVLFIQEVDIDATRSHHINELESLRSGLTGYASSFASNFLVKYIPYPLPPMGHVDAGIATFSVYPVSSAERIQLPCPFSWPLRIVNLKRCLLVSRIPLAGSDKELVLVNLHLEAYDSGEGKIAQTKMLVELLNAEQAKGNYVIAGGDFNQTFSSVDLSKYPTRGGDWMPGIIEVDEVAGDWQFMMYEDVPSCRTLKEPYVGADKSTFQYYVIDGFIVSGNIRVDSLKALDLEFACSDHNPVVMRVTLAQ